MVVQVALDNLFDPISILASIEKGNDVHLLLPDNTEADMTTILNLSRVYGRIHLQYVIEDGCSPFYRIRLERRPV